MNKLAKIIADRIRASGAIPFRDFMEMALYCPVYGYYEKEEDKIGPSGDFYTSVSAGPLFGELLARQFAKWLKIITSSDSKPDTRACLVEAGAHHGTLAADVLRWFKRQEADLLQRVDYVIIEPSETRRALQRRQLGEFATVSWAADLSALRGSHQSGITGVVFSNELLDAMPVHRLGWDATTKAWFEWGVDFTNDQFTWTRLKPIPPTDALPAEIPPQLLTVLPDGFTIETCPAAAAWWEEAARALRCGVLLTLDYGLDSLDFFEPGRHRGTLRAYRRHVESLDVLSDPGEQDITAHVNFDAIRGAGERAGLHTLGYLTQAQFLTRVVVDLWKGPQTGHSWTNAQTRQFQTLTHPEHLGRSFRVLSQGRNFQPPDIAEPRAAH